MFQISAIIHLHIKLILQDLRKTSVMLYFNAICSATSEYSGRILIYAQFFFFILHFILDLEFEKFQIRKHFKSTN